MFTQAPYPAPLVVRVRNPRPIPGTVQAPTMTRPITAGTKNLNISYK